MQTLTHLGSDSLFGPKLFFALFAHHLGAEKKTELRALSAGGKLETTKNFTPRVENNNDDTE